MKHFLSLIFSVIVSASAMASEPVYVGSYRNALYGETEFDVIAYHTDLTVDALEINVACDESNNCTFVIDGEKNIKAFHNSLQKCKEYYQQFLKNSAEVKNRAVIRRLDVKWPKITITGDMCDENTDYDYVEVNCKTTPYAVITKIGPQETHNVFACVIVGEGVSNYMDEMTGSIILQNFEQLDMLIDLISIDFLTERIDKKYEIMFGDQKQHSPTLPLLNQ